MLQVFFRIFKRLPPKKVNKNDLEVVLIGLITLYSDIAPDNTGNNMIQPACIFQQHSDIALDNTGNNMKINGAED